MGIGDQQPTAGGDNKKKLVDKRKNLLGKKGLIIPRGVKNQRSKKGDRRQRRQTMDKPKTEKIDDREKDIKGRR